MQYDEGTRGGTDGGYGGGWVAESGYSPSTNGYGGVATSSGSPYQSNSQTPGPTVCDYAGVTWVSYGTVRGYGDCSLSYPFNRDYSTGAATISIYVYIPPPYVPPPYDPGYGPPSDG
jgi:hypothetical protein